MLDEWGYCGILLVEVVEMEEQYDPWDAHMEEVLWPSVNCDFDFEQCEDWYGEEPEYPEDEEEDTVTEVE